MIVAKRGGNHTLQWLSWKELPQLQWYKKLYAEKPQLFTEVDGVLYKKATNNSTSQQIIRLLNSCLKIAGTNYALALVLSGGERKSAFFHETLDCLENKVFRDKHLWVETFESYIKDHGIKVALIDDGSTHWVEYNDDLCIKPSVLKPYFCTKPQLFEKVGDILFFLPTQNVLLENIFFRAVELAGSEYALAAALSVDKLTLDRHLKNFERMAFKHRENFKTYSKLLSDYLRRTQTLFKEECIYA